MKRDVAASYVFDAYSDADFVGRLAEEANQAMQRGDDTRARACLAEALERGGRRIEMRLRDALRALESVEKP